MARRGRPKHPDILTPREWEVLALIREDLTNDQIAQRLGIGAEGVKYHVSEILGKLGLSSREAAAAWDPRQRPDWTPRWDPTRRPAWATALAPLGFFWRRLTGGLARSAGALSTVTSVGLGVALVAGLTTLGVLVMRTRASSNDASVVVQSTCEAVPAATAKIAFLSRRDGNQEIYVMNPDGSGQTNLSNGPGDDSFGAWSPDGCRIAFTSNRDGNWEIYVMNADGSGLTNFTNDPGDDGGAREAFNWTTYDALAWSPDGSRILFISVRDGTDIYVVNADGSGQTNLTNDPAIIHPDYPAWSPDGSRIGFFDLFPTAAFYAVNTDGSNLTRFPWNKEVFGVLPEDFFGAWSPDGSRNASYGDVIRLPNNPGFFANNTNGGRLAWSPDSSCIAFISDRDGNSEISVANADGSGETNLTNNPALDIHPAWSPDGSRIAFNSERDGIPGNSDIYVMNADGSGVTRLTNPTGLDYDPAWSPAPY